MKKLKWLEENFEGVILVIFLTLLTTLVTLQIIMRYLFHSPFSWSEELCRMLLVWSGFFSIGYCARKGSTIRLDIEVFFQVLCLQQRRTHIINSPHFR